MLLNLVDALVSAAPPQALARAARHTSRSFIDWDTKASFRHIIKYAYKHSKFYRRKFDELKIDPRKIRKPSDLGDFYTTPIDIIDCADEFLCKRPHIAFESSGTTGKSKRVYFSQDELDLIGKFNAAGLFLGGVNRLDRLANAFDFNIWIPGMITHKGLEKGRFFELPAGKVDPMEIYKRIPVYNFNIIFGEPTWLIKLTEIAEKNGPYPLKLIVAGAERMPDGARAWMEKIWRPAKVRMVYGSVESGGILGFEPSDECRGYHIDENNFLPEIVDPDKDGYGEVVFTTLSRYTMPLVRYRNRDISKFIEEKCPCGLPYKRIANFRGRADEMIIASGGNLYPLMFEEILKDVDGITSDWQVVFKLRGMKEIMELNLELRNGSSGDAVKAKVFANIKALYPDMWKNMEMAIFETNFVYHTAGTLRGGRKLLRVVDKRYNQ